MVRWDKPRPTTGKTMPRTQEASFTGDYSGSAPVWTMSSVTNSGIAVKHLQRAPAAALSASPGAPLGRRLLYLHRRTGVHELLPDRLGLFLVDAFLDALGSAIYQVLGF